MADRLTPAWNTAPADELVWLRYRDTEQRLRVPWRLYRRGLRTCFANWQLAGQAAALAPPLCLSQFLATDTPPRKACSADDHS